MTGHYRNLHERMLSCAQLMKISIKNSSRLRFLVYLQIQLHYAVLCVRFCVSVFLEFHHDKLLFLFFSFFAFLRRGKVHFNFFILINLNSTRLLSVSLTILQCRTGVKVSDLSQLRF